MYFGFTPKLNAYDTSEEMKQSMQTWYGNYYIPTNMLICDSDTFEKMGVTTDWNEDGEIDYWDYLVDESEQGGEMRSIDEFADFWLNKKGIPYGYLMLNFNITTVKEGESHLTYYSGTKDMWQLQGAKKNVKIGDPLIADKFPVVEIPVESGDVALINTEKSIFDGYGVGTLFIN